MPAAVVRELLTQHLWPWAPDWAWRCAATGAPGAEAEGRGS